MGQLAKEPESSSAKKEQGRQDAMPVGKILRQSRLHYGLDIADVEAALRIRAMHLTALEEGRTDQLPGRVYAIGFVRAYAEYLGLEGDHIVHLFKTQSAEATRKPELHFPVPASESKLPNFYVLALSLAGLLVVGAGFSFFGTDREGPPSIPPVSEVVRVMNINAGQPPLETAMISVIEAAVGSDDPAALIKPDGRIMLKALDGVWVEIVGINKKPILSRTMKPGDSYLIPDQEGLQLSTGNAGAIMLTVDGVIVPPLGEKGVVLTKVKLDADALKPAETPPSGAAAVAIDAEAAAANAAVEAPPPVVYAPPPLSAVKQKNRSPKAVIVRTPRDREGM